MTFSSDPLLQQAYTYLFSGAFLVVGVCILVCLIRSAKGPHITDRIVAVNMHSTMTVALILWLTVFLGEDWLPDIALLYVLLGVVGMTILGKVYQKHPHYISSAEKREEKEDPEKPEEKEEQSHV